MSRFAIVVLVVGVSVSSAIARDPAVARRPAARTSIDPKQTHLTHTFKHNRPMWSCRFHPDGGAVFAGAQDRLLRRWDLTTKERTELQGHRSWIRRMAFTPDGKTLISGDFFGRLIWWDLTGKKPKATRTLRGHVGYVRSIAVSPDGRFVATGGNDKLVRIWTVEGEPVAKLEGHQRHVYNVAFHPEGKTLISGDLMGVLKQWRVGDWKHLRDFDGGDVLVGWDTKFQVDCGGVRGIAFSPDGKRIAVAAFIEVSNAFAGVGTPAVVLFDYQSGKRIRVLKPAKKHVGACWGVVWHPDGFLIGVGGMNAGKLFFWKPKQPKAFFEMSLPNVAYDLALHPSGHQIAVACYDGALRIYDLRRKPASAKKPKKLRTRRKR